MDMPSSISTQTVAPSGNIDPSVAGEGRVRPLSNPVIAALPVDLDAPHAKGSEITTQAGPPHPLTKRRYDYFAELDDLLARLPVAPIPERPRLPDDGAPESH